MLGKENLRVLLDCLLHTIIFTEQIDPFPLTCLLSLAEISRGGGMLAMAKISLNSSCLLLYCLTSG
jgi:hypothetical protein